MQVMQYKQLFVSDARAKLKDIEDILVRLEKNIEDRKLAEQILLPLHSFKSAAATMNYLRLANSIHSVEELFVAAKQGSLRLTHQDLDNLFMVIDAFRSDVEQIRAADTEM